MQALKEQFRKFYTPKRCLINAGIMFAAVAFFLTQKPEEFLLPIGFGVIGALYLLGFIYLKNRPESK
ncbi:MAG: hypothetical protein RI572_08010 [Salegentibacter sp.]|uniref:PEP-CTERM protein-sorting domain-containing protein n=1 Tax=Salegentibacter flavus TaxID=287099 RepID=A0A1I5C591_9FLAO|nr:MULTISPECIES: hypothetical protein [Salegentibacter]MDR9457341.1 hypothetical protein [Salegentibacter sp.]SFN82148.1 hypothetical protein SAMN05660413_02719 [Salegentibacter flavus]